MERIISTDEAQRQRRLSPGRGLALRRRRWWWLFLGGVFLGALLCYLLAAPLGRVVAARWAGHVAALGGEKVPEASLYVATRLREMAFLLALVAAAFGVGRAFFFWLARRWEKKAWSFLALACLAFAGLNLVAYGMGQTALFWLLLRGRKAENQAQFKAKEVFLREVGGGRLRVALVGSSQAQSQIVEAMVNERIGQEAWMMELHFPGSLAADVHFVSRRWGKDEVDAFIYYSSPLSFFSQNETAVGRDLLRLRDLAEMRRLGGWEGMKTLTKRSVVLGAVLPLFQMRPVLQQALYGFASPEVVPLPVVEAKEGVRREASTIRVTPQSEYQKKAFLRFLELTASRGQRVIVVAGQFNPVHEAEMAPEVRPAYEAFLRECLARFPHLRVVWQDELLEQGPEAYLDATHCTEEVAAQFTAAFCRWMEVSGLPFLKGGGHPAGL